MEAGAEGAAAAGGDILRGEPSKKKSMEESLADSWSFLDKELEEFKKICDELDNGEFLVSPPSCRFTAKTFYIPPPPMICAYRVRLGSATSWAVTFLADLYLM